MFQTIGAFFALIRKFIAGTENLADAYVGLTEVAKEYTLGLVDEAKAEREANLLAFAQGTKPAQLQASKQ